MTQAVKKKKAAKEVPPVASTEHLPVASIERHPSLQTRAEIPAHIAEEYAQQLKDDPDTDLPPIDVYCIQGDPLQELNRRFFVVDGHLRLDGYTVAGMDEIPANIRYGTFRDAILFAVGANHRHGMRRTNADKERAVRLLLTDPDWGHESNHWIARECRVSHTFVATIKSKLEQEYVKSCSSDSGNVSNLSANGQSNQSQQSPPSAPASGASPGTDSPQNSSNSGAAAAGVNGESPAPSANGENPPSGVTISGSSSPENENAADSAADAEKPQLDAWGIPIQPHAVEAFAVVPDFRSLVKDLKALARRMSDLADTAGGKALIKSGLSWHRSPSKSNPEAGQWKLAYLENAIRTIEAAMPAVTDCPYHFNDRQTHDETCNFCHGRRWLGKPPKMADSLDCTKAMKEHYGIKEEK